MAAARTKKWLMDRTKRIALRILADPEIRESIYQSVHRPGDSEDLRPPNIRRHLWLRANDETAAYVEEHMLSVPSRAGRWAVLDDALAAVSIDGLFLEFGVADAKSINYIADRIDRTIYGFDGFEGLPEDWFDGMGKGVFDRCGKLPEVRRNVELVPGWFDATLPKFAASHGDRPIAFMHVDCDLYSSTREVFARLGSQVVANTILVFDEYFNFPGWKNQEYKAFQEFVAERGLEYEYLTYDRAWSTVAVRIK